jgi:[ribosomal protein S5]-alanine N-acetyltransferase
MGITRLVRLEDAPALADLLQVNREFMAPWEPARDEEYFTADGQRGALAEALKRYQEGSAVPLVIVADSGRVAGRITLSGIARGALQSCSVGYWVSAADNGRGLATAAVREIVSVAFSELGLHRIQAETLPHNFASQRVLARNGFGRIGLAPSYLKIAGRWQDCILFQLVNDAAN